MNTKNILLSPFIHVLLMGGFLLFSLGCPATREGGTAKKDATGNSVAAANKPASPTIVAAQPMPAEPAKLPNRVTAAPISASIPVESPNLAANYDVPTPNAPARAGLADDSMREPPPFAVESPAVAEEERPNPLRPSSSGVPLPNNLRPAPAEGKIRPSVRSNLPASPGALPDSAAGRRPAESNALAAAGTKKPAGSPKELRPPLDLIKENGAFFTGWPKPRFALLITGKIEGYLEPCGCAGLERMKGGMGRRYMLFKQLREAGWPVVGLDVGGLAHGFGRQSEIKFHTLAEGMRAMNYGAIALGETDLKLPAGELVAETTDVENKKSPFVSANVGLFGFDAGMVAKSRIVAAGGVKIGVTAVLGKSLQKEIQNAEIEFADPDAAIKKVLPELQKNANLLVLLAHATMEESLALAEKYPQFHVVATSGGNPIPPDEPRKIDGSKTVFVEVGLKGMCAIVLGFYDGADAVRYQRVVLDSRTSFLDPKKQPIVSTAPPPPEMKNLMAAFQDQLKAIGFAGLGLRPSPSPQKESGGRYVGTEKCKPCHEESYKIWRKSGHAKGYQTLAELDPPRNYDPECLSCHVVGWNPQRYFPYESGFKSKEKTPHLLDVGCEDCHGPGELHCKAEEGGDQAKMDQYRKASVITKEESEKNQCRTCHDGENSPDFNFSKYWPYVEHYENQEE
ncbi:MAG: hypothetical protein IT426_13540 [Pirellulales bacterium]|nr:hypothetical protein [Pirellulales bacterium]